jgi:phosphoenolpyruvate-protein kinase (PTS system EI component)
VAMSEHVISRWLSLAGERIGAETLAHFDGIGLIRGEYVQRLVPGQLMTPPVTRTLTRYVGATCTAAGEKEVWYRSTDFYTEEANMLAGRGAEFFEKNPVIGIRGARRSLAVPDEFRRECHAVAELAAEHANLRMLVPFITDEDEFASMRDTARGEGVTCPIGAMIEIPSAALRAEEIIGAGADRLLIGMNDLSCLTAGSQRSSTFEWKVHPAIRSLAERAIDAAHSARVRCGIAGALSADVLDWASGAGVDYASIHYSQARRLLRLGDEPWDQETAENEMARATRAAIDAFNRALLALGEPKPA